MDRRRRRSRIADNSREAAQMSRSEMDSEIARCLWGVESDRRSQLRKTFFKRLIWLEAEREKRFGVPAPKRVFR
jgi:hypothetical protein